MIPTAPDSSDALDEGAADAILVRACLDGNAEAWAASDPVASHAAAAVASTSDPMKVSVRSRI